MKRCWITPGLVRVDHSGLRVGSVRQRFSKQRFGRIGRTKSRQEKVDRGSRRIEGSIEVEPAAFNPQDRKLGARKQRLCRRVPFRLGTLRLRDRERWRRLGIPGEERRACLELLYAGSRAIAALIGETNDAQLFAQYARSGSDRVTASTAPLRFRPRRSGLLPS